MNEQRLAGRFSVVYRDSKCVAVGFVGDVSAHTLALLRLRMYSGSVTERVRSG